MNRKLNTPAHVLKMIDEYKSNVYKGEEDSAEMNLININARLRDMLSTKDYIVTFLKADGTQRVMSCSLNPITIANAVGVFKDESRKVHNDNVISVIDLDVTNWRSFRIDSILDLEEL